MCPSGDIIGGVEEALRVRIPGVRSDGRCLFQCVINRKLAQNSTQQGIGNERLDIGRERAGNQANAYCRATREMAFTSLRYGISSQESKPSHSPSRQLE